MFDYSKIRNLKHCWICSNTASLHEHHIIPQCYGGKDGPLVTLCASCHNGVHHVADGRVDMRPDYWENDKNSVSKSKALIKAIHNARVATSTSQHKRTIVSMELSAEDTAMLKRLQNHYGGIGRVKTILSILQEADARLTIR